MSKKRVKQSVSVVDAGSTVGPELQAIGLPASVAIRNVRQLREQWLAHVSSPILRIDGAAVTDVDTAGLQLLLAWRRAVVAAGGKFEWTAESVPLQDAAAALGLARELGMHGAP